MKKLLLLIPVMAICILGYACYKRLLPKCKVCTVFYAAKTNAVNSANNAVMEDRSAIYAKVKDKAEEAKLYAQAKSMNTQIAFLLNMEQHSGQNRFYVYDLERDSILQTGLVAHGSGDKTFTEKPTFSNQNGSGLSSLGKYKVGAKYNGRFGIAYKLHGLEKTNSNAFSRFVVLHAYSCVPDEETYPEYICNSLGCTMVSNHFIVDLSKLIDKQKKPIVLWVFN
jgi:hypothetical protein